jgi:hypothetical protein
MVVVLMLEVTVMVVVFVVAGKDGGEKEGGEGQGGTLYMVHTSEMRSVALRDTSKVAPRGTTVFKDAL